MTDFGKEISARIKTAAQKQADAERGREQADLKFQVVTALELFNGKEGLAITEAPFLEEEARTALLGLVATFNVSGVRPIRRDRIARKTFRFLGHFIQTAGWDVLRKPITYTGLSGKTANYTRLMVTPDSRVMSSATYDTAYSQLGETYGLDAYRLEFDTKTIVDDVIAQVASRELEWVDPNHSA